MFATKFALVSTMIVGGAALLAAIDANGWVLIIGAVGFIVVKYFDYRREMAAAARAAAAEQRAEERSDRAAKAVSEVKATAAVAAQKVEQVAVKLKETTAATEKKLDGITQTGDAVHTLVNSAMSQQLKIAAVALRRIADLTKHADDIAAAELAEKGSREHDDKQKIVDQGNKGT